MNMDCWSICSCYAWKRTVCMSPKNLICCTGLEKLLSFQNVICTWFIQRRWQMCYCTSSVYLPHFTDKTKSLTLKQDMFSVKTGPKYPEQLFPNRSLPRVLWKFAKFLISWNQLLAVHTQMLISKNLLISKHFSHYVRWLSLDSAKAAVFHWYYEISKLFCDMDKFSSKYDICTVIPAD